MEFSVSSNAILLFFFKNILFIFRERVREGEREGNMMYQRNIDWLPITGPQMRTWPATQAYALTGVQTGDLSVHRPALNPLSHSSQCKHHLVFNDEMRSTVSGIHTACYHSAKKQRQGLGNNCTFINIICWQSEKVVGKNSNIHLLLDFHKQVYIGKVWEGSTKEGVQKFW